MTAPLAAAREMDVAGPALRALVPRVRAAGPDAAVATLAAGDWVEGRPGDVLGDLADDLLAAGLLEVEVDRFRSHVVLWDAGGIVTALPASWSPDAHRVYIQQDSIWLLAVVWGARKGGRRAADLGTGSGFLASVLASRYDVVVAADLDRTCVRYTSANLGFNRTPARATGVVRADCGLGLRSGAFDLVTANAPWSLTPPVDEEGRPRVWADGGHRGFEVPGLFIDDVVRLLAPGGLGVVLALDTEWEDGEAPLRRRVEQLHAEGLDVEVRPSDVFPAELLDALPSRVPGLRRARHVAVLIERPAA